MFARAWPGTRRSCQQANAGAVEVFLEPLRDAKLAGGALLPDAGARRLVDHLGEEDAQTAELGTRVLLARVVPPLVLPQGTRTGPARVDGLQGGSARDIGVHTGE